MREDPHLWVSQRKVEDLESFREKYAAERDKRLPNTGADTVQAIDFEGTFASFDSDPNASDSRTAPPLTADLDVLIVGAGFMGISAGVELKKVGVTHFKILDVATDFGGTWYWNRYPGVRCDVESYVYLPYLEETGYIPTEHIYSGCMIGPGWFAGRRWVAPMRLKDLRFPASGPVAAEIADSSYLAIYWVHEPETEQAEAWARTQVGELYAAGRGFAEREHVCIMTPAE